MVKKLEMLIMVLAIVGLFSIAQPALDGNIAYSEESLVPEQAQAEPDQACWTIYRNCQPLTDWETVYEYLSCVHT